MGKNRDFSKFPNAITVLDNGNVGIGVSNPGYKLSVANEMIVGGQGGSDYLYLSGGSGFGSKVRTYYATGSLNNELSGNSNTLLNLVTGNVGIGTSNPVSLLNIHSGDFTIQKNAIGAGTEVGNINFRNDYMGAYTWAQIKGVNGSNHDFSNITFSTTHGFNSISEKMRISSNGNIGIGTTSPNNKLSIVDSGYNQYSLRLESQSGNTANRWGGIGFAGEGSNTKAGIFFVSEGGSYSRGNLVFANNSDFNQNSATPSDARMSITKEGYITKTGQPFFSAYNSSGASYTGDQTVIWGTALHNVGNGYNTSTGRFTAPVAGVYLFRADFRGSGVSGYVMDIATSTGLLTRHEEYASYANFYHQTLAAIYKLNAGDYVYVWARSGTIAPDGNSLDRFEGYLLG